jgi:hypothetical protein
MKGGDTVNVAGIAVFHFMSKRLKGNCISCGKRMKLGDGYMHTYTKRGYKGVLRTKQKYFCSEKCVTLYSLRKEEV